MHKESLPVRNEIGEAEAHQKTMGKPVFERCVRIVRRDVEELMANKQLKLFLRGLQKDIGKGITHKTWVVSLYLQWKTYSEIERVTGHTVGSIKNYLNDFRT